MEFLLQLWNSAKGFVIGFVVRWLLLSFGAIFTNAGINEGSLESIVGGILAILVSIIMTVIQNKKVLNTPPPTQ